MTQDPDGSDPTWPVLIGTLFTLKQEIETAEPDPLIGFTMAKVRAAPDDLVAAERRIGRLPSEVAQFFLHANGWPGIYFDLDLLAVDDVLVGTDAVVLDPVLESYAENNALPVALGNLLVVGSSSTMPDRVIVVREDQESCAAGTTFWLDEDSRATYAGFAEFFTTVIEDHRLYLRDLPAE